MSLKTFHISAAVIICFLGLLPVRAAVGGEGFDARVSSAYSAVRSAASYLRTGNPGLATLDLGTAQDNWKDVVQTYKDAPPPPYKSDAEFGAALDKIDEAISAGLNSALDGDAEGGRAALLPIRDILFDLRRRNGVDVYADCITEMGRVMIKLSVHRRPAPDMSNDKVTSDVRKQAGRYKSLVQKCRSMASADDRASSEFKRLFDGAETSMNDLLRVADDRDGGAVVRYIREARSLDGLIFFLYGG